MNRGDRDRGYLLEQEIELLSQYVKGADTRLLILFLWCIGCRISEALAVTPNDIDYEYKRVRLPALKRRDQETKLVAIWNNDLLKDLEEYCSTLPEHKPIFQFSRQIAYYRLRIAGQRAGLGKIHPHMLRHSMAINWALAGGSLQLLQRQLGHKSLATTTDMYMKFSSEDILREAQRIFNPHK